MYSDSLPEGAHYSGHPVDGRALGECDTSCGAGRPGSSGQPGERESGAALSMAQFHLSPLDALHQRPHTGLREIKERKVGTYEGGSRTKV